MIWKAGRKNILTAEHFIYLIFGCISSELWGKHRRRSESSLPSNVQDLPSKQDLLVFLMRKQLNSFNIWTMSIVNCFHYFLNLFYYTYTKYWFDFILARGTELYQHVLESVGLTSWSLDFRQQIRILSSGCDNPNKYFRI